MLRVKGNSYKKKKAFWWTSEINEARRDCMRLRRKLKRKRQTAEQLSEIKTNLRYARIKLKNLILTSKKKSWIDLMDSVGGDP